VGTVLGPFVTQPASANTSALYAYATGGAIGPMSCPKTGAVSKQCTLREALSLATAGSTVLGRGEASPPQFPEELTAFPL